MKTSHNLTEDFWKIYESNPTYIYFILDYKLIKNDFFSNLTNKNIVDSFIEKNDIRGLNSLFNDSSNYDLLNEDKIKLIYENKNIYNNLKSSLKKYIKQNNLTLVGGKKSSEEDSSSLNLTDRLNERREKNEKKLLKLSKKLLDSDLFSKKYKKVSKTNNDFYKMKSRSLSRKKKLSNEIHLNVLEKIKSYGYNEKDSRYIKMGLYAKVKELFPNLSNLERAKKLEEFANKKEEVKKIEPKIKEIEKSFLEKINSKSETPVKVDEKKKEVPKKLAKKEAVKKSKK